jgi:putative photosynthetic complex assembly protein 2
MFDAEGIAGPLLFASVIWWFSTGVILAMVRAPRSSYGWSMAALSVLLIGAMHGMVSVSGNATDPGAAYFSFACGIVVWAWQEFSYLTGYLTGPNKLPCPARAGQFRRFWLAIGTSLYHELAVVAAGLSLLVLTWGQPNQVGLWTYCVLWIMRWSAKLNMFFGVRNLNEEWFPDHLRYLGSYLTRRNINLLFPVSVTAFTVYGGFMLSELNNPGLPVFDRAGGLLVFGMLALGTLEHWLLLLPVPGSALWNWFMPPADPPSADSARPESDALTAMAKS